ncbi:hypothetical protein [Ferrimonas senticii]|uniref:hypothetical protein n=1 Tax=Ferrimonas senticii TaxID=394566 RepID=UPI000401A17A|nr:hypothetical protein [Ferrimonas senticii]
MTQPQLKLKRRGALKAIGLGIGGVALGSATAQAAPRASETPQSSSAKPRYRASEHVLTYYATLSEQEG